MDSTRNKIEGEKVSNIERNNPFDKREHTRKLEINTNFESPLTQKSKNFHALPQDQTSPTSVFTSPSMNMSIATENNDILPSPPQIQKKYYPSSSTTTSALDPFTQPFGNFFDYQNTGARDRTSSSDTGMTYDPIFDNYTTEIRPRFSSIDSAMALNSFVQSTASPVSSKNTGSRARISSTDSAMSFDPLMQPTYTPKYNQNPNTGARARISSSDSYHRATKSLTDEEVASCLAEIATSLQLKSNFQSEESRMKDHLTTLGSKAKQSKPKHKKWASLSPMRVSVKKIGNSTTPPPPPSKAPLTPPPHKLANSERLSMRIPTLPRSPKPQAQMKKPSHHRIMSAPEVLGGISFLSGDFTAIHETMNTNLLTSENEPSPHQIELPGSSDTLMFSRLCEIVEDYRVVDQNFRFEKLVGLSSITLHSFAKNTSQVPSHLIGSLVNQHRPIVKSIVECSIDDDLVVEGYFDSGSDLDDVDNKTEAVVFKSEMLRAIIVVFRGSTSAQEKPIRNCELRMIQSKGAKALIPLHKDQDLPILPSFQQAYFDDEALEMKVFDLIDELMEANPFFDLVCTGHSFGGALATIAGVRYATLHPVIRANCIVFGSPRIGGKAFREYAHSLPNLKVVRLQHENDSAFADSPPESLSFSHIGHTILLEEKKAQAFKFDKNWKESNSKHGFRRLGGSIRKLDKKKKNDRSIHSYGNLIKKFTHLGAAWMTDFVGENIGKGVVVKDEKRGLV